MDSSPPGPNNCFDPRIGLIPIADAEKALLDEVVPIADTEVVSLPDAVGRILAEPVASTIDVPPHANSAMDGYAVCGDSLPSDGVHRFTVVGTALAGKPWEHPCQPDETVQVMTGAVMPQGTDTVVIQEDVQLENQIAIVSAGHRTGQNVRQAGEDLERDETAVDAGVRVGAAELGVLASVGVGRVCVFRKPIVAIFSTGDELRNAGDDLPPGAIYDSNRYTLIGLLQSMGLEILNLGIIPDDPVHTRTALADASDRADLIITSGGVSTGSADFVIRTLEELGQISLWRIAIRPGRPFAFGKIQDKLFFGLPGNPVAVMVTFYKLVQPALRRLMGQSDVNPVPIMKARALSRFRKKPNRSEVYRAVLSQDDNGEPVVVSTGQQGSGLLSSMSQANCFVLLDDHAASVNPGDMVDVQLFEGLN
ncbi:MAG: molybdopterin molybdotransferase MoeA [Acidiferrobacterales bacterium]|nr:molybdopterin molybdotransferase MoeA [Acidiferrobacterales bacterium]